MQIIFQKLVLATFREKNPQIIKNKSQHFENKIMVFVLYIFLSSKREMIWNFLHSWVDLTSKMEPEEVM